MASHSGRCFCGAVEVTVESEPLFQGLCHCDDCRAWSGTPVTAYALWPMPAVAVTKGEDMLGAFSKSGSTIRKHCTKCGSLMLAEIPEAGMTDVFPLRLDGLEFTPQAHVFYAMRVLDMPDGLPKFRDMPTEGGGSGEMIED